MPKMPVYVWFVVGAVVASATGCGGTSQDETLAGVDTPSSPATSAAPLGSTCTPPSDTKVTPVVRRTIGYGGMGKYRAYDWIDFGGSQLCAWFEDQCDAGLYPQNVDTQSSPAYGRASPGSFSCWRNYVRDCYVRPDGSRVDYGCGCF
jgi:hypothetical protein